MFEFFDQLLSYVTSFFSFFTNIIASLLLAVRFILDALELPVLLAGVMPPIIGTAVLIFVGLYVLKFLIGR